MVGEVSAEKLHSRFAFSSLFVCGARILINEGGIPPRISFFVKKDKVQMTVTASRKIRPLLVI